jgi:hypothetical protein
MSATNFTPIQLYRTSTAAAAPTAGNLAAGELAINLTDEKLYFKNAAGVVKLLASNSGALGTVTSVDVSGGTTGLTTSGGPITSSGTITLAGTLGVANGGTGTATAFTAGSVVFAGASGVYSQDNANLFWDNANDRLGIGTATPAAKLHLAGSADIRMTNTANTSGFDIGLLGGSADPVAYIYQRAASAMTFATNNTERMRIDSSGNVGIGTSAPNSKLHVSFSPPGSIPALGSGVGGVAIGPAASYGMLLGTISSGTGYIQQQRFDTGSSVYPLALQPNGGDVGIGTSSPGGSYGKLTVAGGIRTVEDTSSKLELGRFSSGAPNSYIKLSPNSASLRFTNAADDTDLMVLTNTNGFVGMGTTSPITKLDVDGVIRVGSGSGAGDPGTGGVMYIVGSGQFQTVIGGAALAVHTGPNNARAERMRIDSSGNVGIGTSSPAYKLDVNGAIRIPSGFSGAHYNMTYTGNADSRSWRILNDQNSYGDFAIQQSTTQTGSTYASRFYIDLAGNVMVGGVTALQSAKLTAYGSVAAQNGGVDGTFANAFVGVYSTNSNEHNAIQTSVSSTGTNSGFRFKASDGGGASTTTTVLDLTRTQTIFYTGGTERMRITSAGYLEFPNTTFSRPGGTGQYIVGAANGGFYQQDGANYYLVTTTGGSTSDATLKKDVQQLDGALQKICAVRGVTFEFIEQPLSTADCGTQIGVIAQEIEAQFPEIVVTHENGTKAVRYDRLVAPLIEAIKELTARVAQLEGN